ncbi:MAG: hypothetical protein CMK83_02860 [Pseudomonadales bacterium]|nr:hypothetical protein [Pseudomonadales bacterium]RLT87335.1 MAG: hypothetical protein D9N13_23190 [Ketobacter sp. GenoA1]RLT94339.1 MAG: hypothetical protein D9N15_18070 [Ketobacter sp.]TNC90537.1 MAG: hypothetical protein CSH49_02300 [Alcanivorax sp.]HBO92017.1 hypothetical protein [Gammaproteobacteria bacterium]|tara:strand:+ start:2586 stop:2786 length:201 start_codon:yes stop_codon:yes gene_type:complete
MATLLEVVDLQADKVLADNTPNATQVANPKAAAACFLNDISIPEFLFSFYRFLSFRAYFFSDFRRT